MERQEETVMAYAGRLPLVWVDGTHRRSLAADSVADRRNTPRAPRQRSLRRTRRPEKFGDAKNIVDRLGHHRARIQRCGISLGDVDPVLGYRSSGQAAVARTPSPPSGLGPPIAMMSSPSGPASNARTT